MDTHSQNSDDPDRHRALFRQVSKVLIDFAALLVRDTGGAVAPSDAASMLISAGLATLSSELGRATAAAYLRELATALELGRDPGAAN